MKTHAKQIYVSAVEFKLRVFEPAWLLRQSDPPGLPIGPKESHIAANS